MAKTVPTDSDRAEAVGVPLSGLASGKDLFELAATLEHLHPPHNTFPGELFLQVAADALELAGFERRDPITDQALLGQHLAEHRFRPREFRKFQFAALASAAARGGIEADVLNEVVRWQTDDFWFYALAAAISVISACAERAGQSVPVFTEHPTARTRNDLIDAVVTRAPS